MEGKMDRLGQFLREELAARHMTIRQLALELKMSHATVTRALAGQPVDIETAILFCNWLGVNLSDLFDPDPSVDNLARQLAVLINREPDLAKAFTNAMQKVDAGEISTEDIRDIIEYATFKLEHYERRRRNKSLKEEQGELTQ
jgi:transcriptional regulator with XRE-family HTH domain